jgi:phosphotransferase family enzyme
LPEAPDFDVAELTPLVRRLLDEPAAELTAWRVEPMAWINLMDAALYRVGGAASVRGRVAEWSLVMKLFPRPEPSATASDPAGWDYWKREINAYACGALDSLPSGFTAPRFAGVVIRPDGAVWLGLEEIADVDHRPWPLKRFEAAARCAGTFNGAYLDGVPLPVADGLGPGGLRSWVELLAALAGGPPSGGPLATLATPRPEDLLSLLAERERLLSALDRLPQTFAHRDFTPVNLLVRATSEAPDEFVTIDWAIAGAGALGEDAAGIVGATLWQLLAEPSAAAALEERVLRGYVAGLEDAGWHGDEALVRFGYAATLGLRFAPLTPAWAADLDDPAKAEWFGRKFGRPPEQIAVAWGQLQDFVLDRGAEAIRLASELHGARSA